MEKPWCRARIGLSSHCGFHTNPTRRRDVAVLLPAPQIHHGTCKLIYPHSWKRRFFNRDVILLVEIEPSNRDNCNNQCADYKIPHEENPFAHSAKLLMKETDLRGVRSQQKPKDAGDFACLSSHGSVSLGQIERGTRRVVMAH